MRAHRRARVVLALASLGVVVLASGCRAAGTPEPSPNVPSSSELVESPKRYDGARVTFTGEAVGEAMHRGDQAWLHLNDDAYYVRNVEEGAHLGGYNTGMPVWIARVDAEKIEHFGDYKHEGDIVTVVGTFNAACAEHGGDMDIHATTLEIEQSGHDVVDAIHPDKIVWATALSLIALALYLLDHFRGEIAHRLGL
jgi:hypothetical protein